MKLSQSYAHSKVFQAIQRGELTRPENCTLCGNLRVIVAHHEDYLKPLDVWWLCNSCHRKRHVALRVALRETPATTDFVMVRIEEDLLALVRRRAGRERRTLTAQLSLIVEEWLLAHGDLQPDSKEDEHNV
jgi:hypothetical protein